jgi:hypothetical protein
VKDDGREAIGQGLIGYWLMADLNTKCTGKKIRLQEE